MSRWFRFYDEALNDPKVQKLDGDTFKAWVNLLCLASKNDGKLPAFDDIAFALRVTENAARTLVERLANATLIDRLNGGANGVTYAPHGWAKRQFKSDTSNERVRRYRDRHRNVTETPPDTEADTETEEIANAISKERDKPARKRAFRCPDDWQPKPLPAEVMAKLTMMPSDWLEQKLAAMKDWSKASPNGAKLDWDAAWRGWVRRELEKEPKYGNGHMGRNASTADRHGNQQRSNPALDMLRDALGNDGFAPAPEGDPWPQAGYRGNGLALPAS